MLNVFESMLSVFQTAIGFVTNIIDGLASMIALIPQSSTMLTNMVAYMPSELAVFATASIAIIIVYMIIGR